ncbi:reverse transcriptase family protein [Colwellia sp. PAMC 21821]|uniref:reverse transcriptase family protein n=1 Tax=Colwellia sp. PAMC 21821 TaxID=1816219 RepID=UPI0009C16501|nr:reverse transcriptase family protein [Colwellia sp. PAMC 21821]ARD44456.1 hypothetical protein A3Q33_09135 [Colwellia sp. PAMC 21821]
MHYNNDFSIFIQNLGLEASHETRAIVSSIIHASENHYRSFNIPKRKGGYRKIDSPYPTLKHLHGVILDVFQDKLKCHKNSFAFMKGNSAIGHAKHHLDCEELLTVDIENFFPSISRQMIFEVLHSVGMKTNDSNYISYICTLRNSLPQGASTSPILSNAVFYPIDIILEQIALKFDLKYSRYADDLAFSGINIPRNLPSLIEKILMNRGFNLNKSKTKLKIKGARKIITGISISSGKLKVPRSFKRDLRANVFELEKFKHNLFEMNNFDPLIYERTIGKLNYLLQVEPESKYAKIKIKLLLESYKDFQLS